MSHRDLTEEEVVGIFRESRDDEERSDLLEGDKERNDFGGFEKSRLGSVVFNADHQLNPRRSRPKEKGLRKLSQRAYEIVLNMRSASYKEVANKLVDELNSQRELEKGVLLR